MLFQFQEKVFQTNFGTCPIWPDTMVHHVFGIDTDAPDQMYEIGICMPCYMQVFYVHDQNHIKYLNVTSVSREIIPNKVGHLSNMACYNVSCILYWHWCPRPDILLLEYACHGCKSKNLFTWQKWCQISKCASVSREIKQKMLGICPAWHDKMCNVFGIYTNAPDQVYDWIIHALDKHIWCAWPKSSQLPQCDFSFKRNNPQNKNGHMSTIAWYWYNIV